MEELYAYRKNLLEALAAVVGELAVVVEAIPTKDWHVRREPGGQTPHQVLAHLRGIEAQALSVRIRRILDEDEPYLPLFHDDVWMADHYRVDEAPQDMLNEYACLRREELSWLADLPPAGWNRAGRHPWWGVRALQWWVEQTLFYTRQHVAQLAPPGEV